MTAFVTGPLSESDSERTAGTGADATAAMAEWQNVGVRRIRSRRDGNSGSRLLTNLRTDAATLIFVGSRRLQ